MGLIFIILQSFNVNITKNRKVAIKSILDSLQGTWKDISDNKNVIIISGRKYSELYADAEGVVKNYNIYFSDTLVDGDLSYSNISIDTTLTSGKYIITKRLSDDSFWCYELNGFYYDGTSLTVSISDTWAHRTPTVYQKQ